MKSQRTFFFAKKPASTPKKDGENPLVPDRRFRAPTPGPSVPMILETARPRKLL